LILEHSTETPDHRYRIDNIVDTISAPPNIPE